MSYKDREKQKEYNKERMRKVRQGNTERVTQTRVTQDYPAIIHALVDKDKRLRLEKIYQSLKDHNLTPELRYGVGGPTFDVVGELLDATS